MSGRKEISADYKAQRSSRPDLLRSSRGRTCSRSSRPSATANVSVEGYEADDVIAALTVQAKERRVPVMVVTGDRDAYQLVHRRRADHVHVPRASRT